MNDQLLLYIGSFFLAFWGIGHFFPTKSVIEGFGDISSDNRNIIAMEWINEGVTLIFIGAVVAAATYFDAAHIVSRAVYFISIICLVVLSIISLFTGARINFLPYKLCPVIFMTSAILVLFGGLI